MYDFKLPNEVVLPVIAENFEEAYLKAFQVDGEALPVYFEGHDEDRFRIVILVELPNGDLRILRNVFNPDSKTDLVELHSKTYDITFDILEDGRYIGNGWSVLNPSDIRALTDSPIIAYGADFDDDGDLVFVEKVWWFPKYMVVDPYDELIEKGYVDFKLALNES